MKKLNNLGASLVEIAIALMIFAFAAIPLYYAMSYGAQEETNLEKVAIATKILESLRDEIKDLEFEKVEGSVGATSAWKTIGVGELPPNAFNELLTGQKKYKDFVFSAEVRKSPGADIDAIEFKAEVSWTTGRGKKSTEKMSFIKVKSGAF